MTQKPAYCVRGSFRGRPRNAQASYCTLINILLPMALHIAILIRPYSQMILDGRKTIESRLTVTPREPFKAIAPGERIYFKESSGPFFATAIAGEIFSFDNLTRARIDELKQRFNKEVCGQDEFWHWKRDAKYATFIRLRQVLPTAVGPAMEPSRGPAWFVLPDNAAADVPLPFQIALTAGAIRNSYLRVPRKTYAFAPQHYGGKTLATAGKPLRLILPNKSRVDTDIVSNYMIRWRGWGALYKQHDLRPGDQVRFVPLDRGQYRVQCVRHAHPSR